MDSANVEGEFLENAIFGSDRLDLVIVRFHIVGPGMGMDVQHVVVFLLEIDLTSAPKVISIKDGASRNDVLKSQFDSLAQVCVTQVVDGDRVMRIVVLEECPFDVVTKGFVEISTLVNVKVINLDHDFFLGPFEILNARRIVVVRLC